MGERVDGRRLRGEQRRAAIIEATLAVVVRDGAAGVTHRTVAEEAGITVSLTTYYFSTLDELLVAALTSIADEYAAAITALIDGQDDALRGFARLVAASNGEGRARAVAERELSTLAARRAALRPVAQRWRSRVADLARRYTGDELAVSAMVAAADGLCAGLLMSDRDGSVDEIVAVLVRCLSLESSGVSAGELHDAG